MWKDEANRRQWFIDFAKRNGFDPVKLSAWSSVPVSQILAAKVCNLMKGKNSVERNSRTQWKGELKWADLRNMQNIFRMLQPARDLHNVHTNNLFVA